ncbi:acetyltransferase (GNAT) family protein [Rhodobacter aestuarii]|uniref:Acetyltransferase (GNAT) family protein n=1 Tax=Rhodobacter aestuarii TaxID=453582 RepID=A0A1N7LPH0_9RHOB|nr:GNAT family N-acetyltransferase [Rhodobacter aestuarii]PTV95115.1 acetyltransferase (GNAT) family protein [Rhodobacter aestuarii]SIS75753.1 Acetyltransferase (GNAT) family protein [Rhodobacter aestuarii]
MTDFFAVIDATWPAASTRRVGGFVIREGLGGGSRVSCASLEGAFDQADIAAAEAAHRALGQQPKFMLRPEDTALDAALEARCYELFDPVVIYTVPIAQLPQDVPPVTAFAHWPPLAIAREVWDETSIGPERQAVMARATGPKAVVLGRKQDRAAGAGFVAIHEGVAMVHALSVLPSFRRHGLARAMMAEATRWAAEQGAETLALVVTRANAPANALYRALGMAETCSYHYRREVTA